ncbi:MAG: hypothetical protein AAF488_16155, partial [Planctomycetota bacterium]
MRFIRNARWLSCVVTLTTAPLLAVNEYSIVDATLDSGTTDEQSITILAENDRTILGYSYGVGVEENVLEITDIQRDGTVAEDAEFYAGGVAPDGLTAGYGIVFDIDGDFADQKLDPGSDHIISIVQVVVDDDAQGTAGTTTMSFVDASIFENRPPIRNVMTDPEGLSIKPTAANAADRLSLVNGTITLDPGAPNITDLVGNFGQGGAFEIVGENFDGGDLEVTLDGLPIEATLREDGVTIDAVAPECDAEGTLALEVCTARGCDTENSGYICEAALPVINSVSPAEGVVGSQVNVDGDNFQYGPLVVSICGVEVNDEDAGPGVTLTVPDRCELGTVEIEICNRFGCDTAEY